MNSSAFSELDPQNLQQNFEKYILPATQLTDESKKAQFISGISKNISVDNLGLRWNLWQMQLGVFTLGKYTGVEAIVKRREKYEKLRKDMIGLYDDIDEERDSNPLM